MRCVAFLVVARMQPALDHSAQALERGGGDDPFGRSADAIEQIDPCAPPGRRDRSGNVAVGDQINPRTQASAPAPQSLRGEDDRVSSS